MEQSLLNEALVIDPRRTVALTIAWVMPSHEIIAKLTGDSVKSGPALGRRPESFQPDQEKSRT